MTPQFRHDCTTCQYLGAAPVAGRPTDWYLCRAGKTRPGDATILGRHSDSPPDYWSMLVTLLPSLLRETGSAHAIVAREMLHRAAGAHD